MGSSLTTILRLAVAVSIVFPLAAGAQERGPVRKIQMFNFLCLSQLPDISGVTKAAGFGEFAQITGKELQEYQPSVPADELYAWSYHEEGDEYVLTATRGKPEPEIKTTAPAFASATSTACSLSFPTNDPKEALLKELVALLGRGPDKSWDEAGARVYAWSGQNQKLLSHVHYYEPHSAGPSGKLSASTYVKP